MADNYISVATKKKGEKKNLYLKKAERIIDKILKKFPYPCSSKEIDEEDDLQMNCISKIEALTERIQYNKNPNNFKDKTKLKYITFISTK